MALRNRPVLWAALAIGVYLLYGCETSRVETVKDATTDRKTVVKETKLRQGVEAGQPVDVKETTYREEVSQEVAHSEQNRSTSLPVADAFGGLIQGLPSTGNPIIDWAIPLVGLLFRKKATDGVVAAAGAVKKKFTKKASLPNVG